MSDSMSFRSWLVLIAVGVLVFLVNIDYTAVNLTLVPISEEIDADLNSLQWLLSGYVLILGALVIPAGRIADLYGKRNTLIGGLLIFMIGSVLTGLGNSLEALILGRIAQGVGAAIFIPPAWTLIFSLAPPKKQGFVMGIILSFAGFGLAAGPTLAGLIIQELNWRWIFYINIPLGIIIIATLMLCATKDIIPKAQEKVDIIGTILLASGMCLSVYSVNQIDIWGIASPKLWTLIFIGVSLILVFVAYNKKQKVQMVPVSLFRNKAFMAATFAEFFMAINFSLVLVMMGLYLQNTLHYTSYEAGLIFISLTISMGFLSPVGGKMIDAFGIKEPMIFGALCTGLGVALMAFLKTDSSLVYVLVAMFVVGTGLGAFFTACNTAMMRAVPQDDINVASGVFTMFMMIGNTLSVILSTSFVVLFGQSHLLQSSQKHGMALSAAQHQDLVSIISKVEHSVTQLKDFAPDQIPHLIRWIDESFVYGMSINMMMGCAFSIIAALLTAWGIKSMNKA